MNIALPADLKKFVEAEVRAGRYDSNARVIEAALSRLMLEPVNDFAPGELAALIAEGDADEARGDVSDADAVFERLRKFSDDFKRRTKSAGKTVAKR